MKRGYKVIEFKTDFRGVSDKGAVQAVERCVKADLSEENAKALASKMNEKQSLVTDDVFLSYVSVPEVPKAPRQDPAAIAA